MAGIPGMGKPSSLPPAVGTEPPVPELNFPDANIMNAGGFQVAPSAEPEIDYDALAAEAVGQADEIDYDALAAEAVSAEDVTISDGESATNETLGLVDQFKQLPTRLRGSFARTNKELKQVLQDEYGKNNVRESGDTLEFKLDGKWREYDKGVEVLGDIADFGRDVVEEVPATVGTLLGAGGAVTSTFASGGAAGVAAPALVAGGRAAGALVGQGLGDLVASAIGIERDKDRNAYMEYGLSALLAPLGGAAGDFAAKKLATRAAIKKAAPLMAPEELFKAEISNIKSSTEDLVAKGFMQNIPGTDTPLILSQTVPSSKVAREITKAASERPEFEQVLKQQADSFSSGVESFLSTMGKNAPETGTGVKFQNAVKQSIADEGRLIGEVRKDFIQAAGNSDLPVKNLQTKLQAFRDELGFREGMKAENVAKELADNGFDPSGAKIIADKTEKIFEAVFNKEGRLSAKELMGYYTEVNGLYGNIVGSQAAPSYVQKVGELRRMITDELNDKVRVVAGENTGASYLKNLEKYSALQNAREEMVSVLDNNVVNSNALARAVFDGGKNGLDKLKATKVLLRDNPELFEQVRGQFFNNIKAKPGVYNDATGKINYNKFFQEIDKLGPEMIEEAFGPNHKATFESFRNVAKAMDMGNVPALGTPQRAGRMKNIAVFTANFSPYAAASVGAEQMARMSGAEALASTIQKEGIDKFLVTIPKAERPMVKKAMDGFVNIVLKTAAGPDNDLGVATRGILTRQAVRNMDSREEK